MRYFPLSCSYNFLRKRSWDIFSKLTWHRSLFVLHSSQGARSKLLQNHLLFFWSYNQFYRAGCTTVSWFLKVSLKLHFFLFLWWLRTRLALPRAFKPLWLDCFGTFTFTDPWSFSTSLWKPWAGDSSLCLPKIGSFSFRTLVDWELSAINVFSAAVWKNLKPFPFKEKQNWNGGRNQLIVLKGTVLLICWHDCHCWSLKEYTATWKSGVTLGISGGIALILVLTFGWQKVLWEGTKVLLILTTYWQCWRQFN